MTCPNCGSKTARFVVKNGRTYLVCPKCEEECLMVNYK